MEDNCVGSCRIEDEAKALFEITYGKHFGAWTDLSPDDRTGWVRIVQTFYQRRGGRRP